MMKYELVIFDLDGTLLDTLDDLAAAANYALALRGFPPRERGEVRRFIGNGVANLMRRAVPEGTPEAVALQALSDFKGYYLQNVNVHTRPYPGIIALLEALNGSGVMAAVNSNKVDRAVQALCAAHFPKGLSMALGEKDGIPRKPAPDGAEYIIQALGAARERTLYVGDGEADIMTARNAGLDCAWVSWGYRKAEELGGLAVPHRFDSAEELGRFILG